MRKTSTSLALLAAGLCISSAVQAQQMLNPFGVDTRFYVAPMFSYTFADDDRATDNGFGGSIAIGKRVTRNLDLEVIGFFTHYGVSGSDQRRAASRQAASGFPPNDQSSSLKLYGIGAGFNLYAFDGFDELLGSRAFDHLYIHGDIERGQGRGEPGPVRDYTSTLYNAGLGYNLPLNLTFGNLLGPGMALRVEALYRLDQHNHDYIGAGNSNYFEDVVINVGLRIPLGGRPEPIPEQSEPVQVVPAPAAPAAPPPPPPPPCQPPAAGQAINLAGCKTGDTIVLRGVNFEFNKARLTPNAKTILSGVSDALLAKTDIQVEIDGYTDSVGADTYNLKLSQQRSDSVKQYLVGRGIDAGRMSTMGFGETKPVADNNTDNGRELNRRVELKITAESNPEGSCCNEFAIGRCATGSGTAGQHQQLRRGRTARG